MLQAFFHAWERQLAAVTTDRVVRPFEWGLEWIPSHGHSRMLRRVQFEGDEYVPLARRAYELWSQLERESGRGLALVRDLTREWQGHVIVRAEEPPWTKAVGACFPAPAA